MSAPAAAAVFGGSNDDDDDDDDDDMFGKPSVRVPPCPSAWRVSHLFSLLTASGDRCRGCSAVIQAAPASAPAVARVAPVSEAPAASPQATAVAAVKSVHAAAAAPPATSAPVKVGVLLWLWA